MKARVWFVGCAALMVAGCVDMQLAGPEPQNEFIETLPEGVLAVAATDQDLTATKIDPVDGCYVYRHVGPVETTFLPLRTRDGRPICTRAAEAPAEAAAET